VVAARDGVGRALPVSWLLAQVWPNAGVPLRDGLRHHAPVPRRFLPVQAWRARAMIAVGVLLAPVGARVLWLEHAWGARDTCLVRGAHVIEVRGGYRVLLGIDLSAPDCRFTIDGSPPLATKAEADRRAGAFLAGGTIDCYRPPGLCGAAVERGHVAFPFWLFPIASLALLAAGTVALRRPSAPPPPPHPAVAGPFRMAPPDETAPREPLVLSLPGPGAIGRISAALILLPPGVIVAPVTWWSLFSEPLDSIWSSVFMLVLLGISAAPLTGGLFLLLGRRRLVLDGAGRFAFCGAGFGPLDFTRAYTSFDAWPGALVEPVHRTPRNGTRHVVGFALVLSDGRSKLRVDDFRSADAAAAAAARIEAHRPA
jgi:hypothetical protein